MKELIKRVAPSGALNALRAAESRVALAAEARRPFDASRLAQDDEVDLSAAMDDPAAGAAWRAGADVRDAALAVGEIDGGVNPGDRRALFHLTFVHRPARVLEIGGHVGASTTVFAQAMAAGGPTEAARLVSVDIVDVNAPDGPWAAAGLPSPPAARVAAIAPGLEVRFRAMSAATYFDAHAADDGPFDLILLDGDHRAPAVYTEISTALPHLAPGGVILLHDHHPDGRSVTGSDDAAQGPRLAVERIAREAPEIVVRPFGALPWPTKAGSNMTSLSAVLRRNA